MTLLMQSKICEIRLDFFQFENPMTQDVGFWPKSDDLGHQIFKPKNGMLSKDAIHDSKQQQNDR